MANEFESVRLRRSVPGRAPLKACIRTRQSRAGSKLRNSTPHPAARKNAAQPIWLRPHPSRNDLATRQRSAIPRRTTCMRSEEFGFSEKRFPVHGGLSHQRQTGQLDRGGDSSSRLRQELAELAVMRVNRSVICRRTGPMTWMMIMNMAAMMMVLAGSADGCPGLLRILMAAIQMVVQRSVKRLHRQQHGPRRHGCEGTDFSTQAEHIRQRLTDLRPKELPKRHRSYTRHDPDSMKKS